MSDDWFKNYKKFSESLETIKFFRTVSAWNEFQERYSNHNFLTFSAVYSSHLPSSGVMKYFGAPFGYNIFVVRPNPEEFRIIAGCRWFTYEQALEHWTPRVTYGNYAIRERAIGMVAMLPAIRQSVKFCWDI